MDSARISIWFFVGVLLLIYGVLIMGYGIFAMVSGVPNHVALANLHAPVWWGALLVALGLFYVVKFRPGRVGKHE